MQYVVKIFTPIITQIIIIIHFQVKCHGIVLKTVKRSILTNYRMLSSKLVFIKCEIPLLKAIIIFASYA